MKKLFYLFILFLSSLSFGQDLHFSQFFTNKMILNPALTGAYKQDYGTSLIYRNQWPEIDAKYTTIAHSCDGRIKLGAGYLGLGTIATKDDLPSAKFKQVVLGLSSAYHFFLDYPKHHLLSFGLKLGLVSKTFDPGLDLQFGNQYQNFQFNPDLPNQENLPTTTLNSFNINAGVNYQTHINSHTRLKTGLTMFSITTPNESFIGTKNENQLGIRYISYAMLDYDLNEKIIISPKILYTNQSRGEDINFGSLVTYKFNNCSYINAGLFHRWKDSGIIMLGYGWRSYLIRGSVDFTSSSLREISGIPDTNYAPPRSYEIGIVYTGLFKKNAESKFTVPCGIF